MAGQGTSSYLWESVSHDSYFITGHWKETGASKKLENFRSINTVLHLIFFLNIKVLHVFFNNFFYKRLPAHLRDTCIKTDLV